ncbi:hypothetical protein BJ138DRAFT_1145715 [Hygrophoropsis aurantiaca]|uniref:Uncharacterized protein n=1 Tax=Hygrophoropsis aurantiaca TaxID=72124 RepID=A0ACB8AK70_9AGAM|nr:hypothetical protein BJ138DRAFT_1145715 [Hygrophoropsis aurantiaca]
MSSLRTVVPAEDELRPIVVELKAEHPTTGISKIHGLVLAAHPTWQVSEKRVRKFLQNEGLIASQVQEIHPSSRLNEALDIQKWTTKAEVKYFNQSKGKGLVAKDKIAKGDVIWKEDPFILAPEWNIYDLQVSGRACAHCSTIFREITPLNVACSFSDLKTATPCSARFCTRLCLSHSSRTHPLLCAAQNPASIPLLAFARRAEWMALHALAQCTSRLLLARQKSDEAQLVADMGVVNGLAELGMEDRFQSLRDKGVEPDRDNWRKAFELYLQAFKTPAQPAQQKKLARILKTPLPQEMDKEFFEYDAFLRGLGRMSLNIESHGGLYTLHSHINHSCDPNVSVRHLDQRTALARITLIAKREIEPNEELLVTYVDPSGSLRTRRTQLEEWGFGLCQCERCVAEEKAAKESGVQEQDGMDDLAEQLKAGLGVM